MSLYLEMKFASQGVYLLYLHETKVMLKVDNRSKCRKKFSKPGKSQQAPSVPGKEAERNQSGRPGATQGTIHEMHKYSVYMTASRFYIVGGDLTDDRYGHTRGFGEGVQDVLGGGDEELVVFPAGRGEHPGVASQGHRELARVIRDGDRVEVHPATDPAPLADVADVGGEAV